jgi:2-dehydropantoate 2-reductase
MKIAVIGPGAMGSLFSAAFARGGKHEVWLLDKRRDRAAALAKSGVSVEGVSGQWEAKMKVTADPREIGPADMVMVCVKSYDTKEAVASAKPLLGPATSILTLQNGLGNIETIAETAGMDRVIAGVTNDGATLIRTGQVRHAGKGETVIGRIDGKMPVEMRAIREAFNKAGFQTRVSQDIKGLIWSKLVINTGINALTALTRLPNGKLPEHEGTRAILRQAVTEAVKVAKRKRVKLQYDDPLAKVEAVCEATAGNISSMLQDVLRGKRTEIEYINGAIVRQAQELSIPAPVNTLLLELIKTIESSYPDAVSAL